MTHRSPVPNRGNSHFRDFDGTLLDAKFEDEIVSFDWDLTDRLPSGVTVSSVVADAQSGLSVTNESLATPVWSCDVTNTGVLKLTATLSDGDKVIERFAWQPKSEGTSDYGS